jgi:CBS domain-containing protein
MSPAREPRRRRAVIDTKKSPRQLMARNLMAKVVVTIPLHMSLCGAARLLSRAEASAAPVIEANGRCVGLLAASAFVPLVASKPGTRAGAFHECAWSDWQILEGGANREDEVSGHLQGALPLVGPEAPLREIVRAMVETGADCVIVVDAEGMPLGIVSAAQVLAAVAHEGPARGQAVGARGSANSAGNESSSDGRKIDEAGTANAIRNDPASDRLHGALAPGL